MFKSQPTDDKLSLIGAWSGHVTSGAPIISLERLNLKSSNFVHEYVVSILCNRLTYHQQKGVVMVT